MKKRLTISALLLLIFCALPLTAFAETFPMEDITPTEDVIATEDPFYTEVPIDTGAYTDPYYPTDPIDTGVVDTTPTDYTEPATGETTFPEETTAPVTEVHTNPPAPTEPDENSTYSDYVSPDPVYTPADQDFQENDWQEIKLDLKADPVAGKQSFEGIQKNNSRGNDSIAGFLIAGIILIFLSIAGFTFVFLYNPYKKKKAPAKAGARYAQPQKQQRNTRPQQPNRRTYNPDDYNDGF